MAKKGAMLELLWYHGAFASFLVLMRGFLSTLTHHHVCPFSRYKLLCACMVVGLHHTTAVKAEGQHCGLLTSKICSKFQVAEISAV